MIPLDYLKYIASIISGLAVTIPLVIKLCSVIKELIKNKNWNTLITLIIQEMSILETSYETGLKRKQVLMSSLQTLAIQANYPLTDEDIDKISVMIDDLCDMAHVVGATK